MNLGQSWPVPLLTERSPFSLSKVSDRLASHSSSSPTNRCSYIDDGQWGADIFSGHAIGCNAVSWAPATIPGSLITPSSGANLQTGQPHNPTHTVQSVKRFATAGCDNLVKIWGYREDTQSWVEEEILEGHTDWVRDVAWAPNIGLPRSYIATASQVGTVNLHIFHWTSC
jgi:protein transport protein SEC13